MCQWMEKTHPHIARYIKEGVTQLTKRSLIQINYNLKICGVIYDRLDDFAKYVITFHEVAHRIKRLTNKGQLNVTPIQIDYYIIPQMSKGIGDIKRILQNGAIW
eukprot:270865_1